MCNEQFRTITSITVFEIVAEFTPMYLVDFLLWSRIKYLDRSKETNSTGQQQKILAPVFA